MCYESHAISGSEVTKKKNVMAGKDLTRTAEVSEMWSRAPGVFTALLKGL